MDKLSGKVVDVFEAMVDKKTYANSYSKYSAGLYLSQYMANEAINKQGFVIKKKALEVKNEDGTFSYFLLEQASVNCDYNEAAVAKAGLAKLTEEEKDALGIVEFDE